PTPNEEGKAPRNQSRKRNRRHRPAVRYASRWCAGRLHRTGFGVVFEIVARTVLEEFFRDQAGILPQRRLDLARRVGVVAQEQLGVLAALAETLRIVGEPGTRLLDHPGLDAEI